LGCIAAGSHLDHAVGAFARSSWKHRLFPEHLRIRGGGGPVDSDDDGSELDDRIDELVASAYSPDSTDINDDVKDSNRKPAGGRKRRPKQKSRPKQSRAVKKGFGKETSSFDHECIKQKEPISGKRRKRLTKEIAAAGASKRIRALSADLNHISRRKQKKTLPTSSDKFTDITNEVEGASLAEAKQALQETLVEEDQIMTRAEWWKGLITGAMLLIFLVFTTNSMNQIKLEHTAIK